MKECVSCETKTTGSCGNDPVCFYCYVTGTYARWLEEVGRGDEVIDKRVLV